MADEAEPKVASVVAVAAKAVLVLAAASVSVVADRQKRAAELVEDAGEQQVQVEAQGLPLPADMRVRAVADRKASIVQVMQVLAVQTAAVKVR